MKANRPNHAARYIAAVLGVALASLSPAAHAAAGDLDPSFGSGGVHTLPFANAYAYADEVARQADGKIVVLGTAHSSVGILSDFALVRLLSDGSLDTTFGDEGRVTTDFDGRYDEGLALALQRDGKIVAAGSSTGSVAVARYLPNGSADTSFSQDGRLLLDLGVEARARDLAIQGNGKIVVAIDDSWTFSVARLNRSGTLNRAFGDGGIASEDFSADSSDGVRAVALDGAGGILLGGLVVPAGGATHDDWGLARFNRRGALDTGFGDGGLTTTDFAGSGPDVLEDLVIQPDGMIVAAGQSSTEPGDFDQLSDVTVARYDAQGVLDPDFGDNGWVRTDLGSVFDTGRSVALGPDGTILVASDVYEDANAQAAAVRYTAGGMLDTTFGGGDGVAVVDTPSSSDQAFGVIVQPNGRVVIAGSHATVDQNGTSFEFLVARFRG
jgi:uncharacterized delta-60 repeat protein